MPPSSVFAALGIGISLGLLGGGGSILTVPALIYWVGLPPLEATTSSLVVVGLASLAAAAQHRRGGRLRLRAAALFAGAGIPGSYLGSLVSLRIPPRVLLIAFAVLMACAGLTMLLRREVQPEGRISRVRLAVAGCGVGFLTGLLGVGGGFLIVPALVLFADLPMEDAVGTSVIVIAVNCASGFAGRLSAGTAMHWELTLVFSAIAVAGSFAGAALVGRIAAHWLRRGFALFVLALASYMMANNLPATAG